jgi:hypothetical protein
MRLLALAALVVAWLAAVWVGLVTGLAENCEHSDFWACSESLRTASQIVVIALPALLVLVAIMRGPWKQYRQDRRDYEAPKPRKL